MTKTRTNLDEECRLVRNWPVSQESKRDRLSLLKHLHELALKRPGGYIQRILWDEAGGYPEHAWGFVQHTVRPFVAGQGCDGTTDDNVHLIGLVLTKRLGLDYAKLYAKAYSKDRTVPQVRKWTNELEANTQLAEETLIPAEDEADRYVLLLGDLYQLNNRSLVDVLEKAIDKHLPAGAVAASRWCALYDEARKRNRDRLSEVVRAQGANQHKDHANVVDIAMAASRRMIAAGACAQPHASAPAAPPEARETGS